MIGDDFMKSEKCKMCENASMRPIRFGFLVCGVAWGELIGGIMACLAGFSGASGFPLASLSRYCGTCIAMSPFAGLVVGIVLDKVIQQPDTRERLLKNLWVLFVFCAVVFVLIGPALAPAY